LSRWPDATPEALIYERQGDGALALVAEGAREEVGGLGFSDRLLGTLESAERPLTPRELADAAGISPPRGRDGLAVLTGEGHIVRVSEARGNQGARYWPAGGRLPDEWAP